MTIESMIAAMEAEFERQAGKDTIPAGFEKVGNNEWRLDDYFDLEKALRAALAVSDAEQRLREAVLLLKTVRAQADLEPMMSLALQSFFVKVEERK